MRVGKLWSFGKVKVRTVKDNYVSKLPITENHMKLEELGNSQVIYDILQNELYEDMLC